jgi:hypothetical protein
MVKLDAWLAQLFDPENLEVTIEAMAASGGADEYLEVKAEAARRKLADCNGRLAKYRSALDSGADPVIVSGWMAEVQGERLRAEADLASCAERAPLSPDEIRSMLEGLDDLAGVLAEADPNDKASIYSELGVCVTYHPDQRLVVAEVLPDACTTARVGGPIQQFCHQALATACVTAVRRRDDLRLTGPR